MAEQFSPQERYIDQDEPLESPPDVPQPREAPPAMAPHHDDNEPSGYISWANFKVGVVNIVSGTLNGYSIGFVGVYSTIYGFSTNCDDFKAEKSCTTLSNADCAWTDSSCVWKNQDPCKTRLKSNCEDDDHCTWDYGDKDCKHKTGYTSVQSGVFAGAMIVGCMISSTFAGPIVKRLGPKISFLIVGIVGVICSVLYHISTAVDQFWVLCAARLVIGLVLGLINVAAPMYVIEHAHPKYAQMIGVLFQVFTTFGIFLAALMGLLMGQTVGYTSDSNQHLMGRMQGLCVFSTVLSLVMCMLGIFLGRKEAEENEEENVMDVSQLPQYTYGQMAFPLLIAFFTAGTLQLTGINAVMNYAPTIMKAFGTSPLVGNFIVMLWNFVTTIGSIPLARVFSMRKMFLGGSLVTSVACLFLCGIPVYPGVASNGARNGVAITGILIFIAFFEFGVGPCFYILAQQLFPRSFRPRGSSFTMMWQFIFNVIINVCYPIATEGISGGPSGDQNKGQSVAFIFFGAIGLVCFVFEVFFLYPWPEEAVGGGEHTDEAEDTKGDRTPELGHVAAVSGQTPAGGSGASSEAQK